jgi:hypothetical protein
MRHQRDLRCDVGQRAQSLVRRPGLRRRQAEPVHAGVELQPHAQRARVSISFEPAQLRFVMHDGVEPQPAEFGQVGGLVGAAQNHDAAGDAGGTQAQTVAERGDAECIRVAERARDSFQAVAVAVGLDDRHDLRAVRLLAQAGEIASQRAEVDCRERGAAHRADRCDRLAKGRQRPDVLKQPLASGLATI